MSTVPFSIREYLTTHGLAAAHLAYVVTDRNGCVRDFGGDFPHHGLPEPVCGNDIDDHLPFLIGASIEDDADFVLPHVQVGDAAPVDVRVFSRDGRHYILLFSLSDRESVLQEMQQLANETSLRHDELEREHARLHEVVAKRDQFAHMAVHDLRTPLTTLSWFVEIIGDRYGDLFNGQEQNLFDYSQQATQQASRLAQLILDCHRLEQGDFPLKQVPCNLASIVTSATNIVRPAALVKNVMLSMDLADTANVLCDHNVIDRVIWNLLSNALDFTPDGGAIKVELSCREDSWEFAVLDEGPGVPEDEQDRIFDMFVTLKTERHRKSTGLGLAFCRMAVEAHGGRIGVGNVPGGGSRFWFALPAALEQDP